MTLSWWDRWGPLSGALAVATFIVAAIVFGKTPNTDDSDQKILSYYASHSHQVRAMAGFFLVPMLAIRSSPARTEACPLRLFAACAPFGKTPFAEA